jgi:hypothetical protein
MTDNDPTLEARLECLLCGRRWSLNEVPTELPYCECFGPARLRDVRRAVTTTALSHYNRPDQESHTAHG